MAQGATRITTPPVQLIPIGGSRCAVLCPARAGARLLRLAADTGQAQEIDRQRIIRKRRVLWLLYLNLDGVRLGDEVRLEFAEAAGRIVAQRARLVLGAWSEDVSAAVWQMVRRLAGEPGLAPDHGALIRFLSLVSAWGIRADRVLCASAMQLVIAAGEVPVAPLRHRQCLVIQDGRLSIAAAAARPAGRQHFALAIGCPRADGVFFEVEERLVQLECEHAAGVANAAPAGSGVAAQWLDELGGGAQGDLAALLDEAVREAALSGAAEMFSALSLPAQAKLHGPDGAVEIVAAVRCASAIMIFGRLSGGAGRELTLTARAPGAAGQTVDWRAYSHVEPDDGATLRFVAVLQGAVAAPPAIGIEAASGPWRAHAWLIVRSAAAAGVEQLAERWRPLALLDEPYLRHVLAPLRPMRGDADLIGPVTFAGAPAERSAAEIKGGVSVLILADGDAELLHRTLVALHLTLDAGRDEAIVLLSEPARMGAIADLLDSCARGYGMTVKMQAAAGQGGELQLALAGIAGAARPCRVLIRSGDVPAQRDWLRGVERNALQHPRSIMFDRVPAAAEPIGVQACWPRAVALPQGLLPLLARVDPTLRTLDGGLADLSRSAAAGGASLMVAEELTFRRAAPARGDEAAAIARRVDAHLLAGRSWEEGVVDLERVRRAGRRVRR